MVSSQSELPNPERILLHLEAKLGPLDESGSIPEDLLSEDGRPTCSILCFRSDERPSYVTFGLSRHLLEGTTGAAVAQELALLVDDTQYAIDVLSTLASWMLDQHCAVAPGDYHGFPALLQDSSIKGVIAVTDDDLPPLRGETPEVQVIRLLPVTEPEAEYASRYGSEGLRDLLKSSGLDLRNIHRALAL